MHKQSVRVIVVLVVALVTALAGADRASADGAVNIDSCQTLSTPNTTYRLIADISNPADCLIVAADRITIDLQGHSLISPIATDGIGITDREQVHDLIVIKNGTISGYALGIFLNSTRVSVIAVTANNNLADGMFIGGSQALVKSSTASSNARGISAVGPRAQVQQSTATQNHGAGISTGNDCLVTMNTANDNRLAILVGERCTVSYNTANDNGDVGILAELRSLVTHNTAMGNRGSSDFEVRCPSDVTFNTSTNGFPSSYLFRGNGCKTVGNE